MGVKAVLPICVPSFGKKCDLNSTVYLYFIQNSRLHGIKLVRLPNSSRKKLRSLLFTKPVCPAELVLINSDIPKFILHIQWLLWKAGSEITKSTDSPIKQDAGNTVFLGLLLLPIKLADVRPESFWQWVPRKDTIHLFWQWAVLL